MNEIDALYAEYGKIILQIESLQNKALQVKIQINRKSGEMQRLIVKDKPEEKNDG